MAHHGHARKTVGMKKHDPLGLWLFGGSKKEEALPPEEQMRRILADSSQPEFNKHEFWTKVHSAPPALSFQPLCHLSLHFWVRAFNRWAPLRTRAARLNLVSGLELMEILCLEPQQCADVVRLLDPQAPGLPDERWLENHTVNAVHVLVGGVLASSLISAQQALRFLCTLFDFEGSESLDVSEFAMCFRAVYSSLQRVYVPQGLPDVPTQEITVWAEQLYHFAAIDVNRRCPERLAKHRLSFSELAFWLLESGASLAHPCKLLLERHAGERLRRLGDGPEPLFDYRLNYFRLNFHHPEPLTLEDGEACTTLDRRTVLQVADVFARLERLGRRPTLEALLEHSAALGPLALVPLTEARAREVEELARGALVHSEDLTLRGVLKLLGLKSQVAHHASYQAWARQYYAFCADPAALKELRPQPLDPVSPRSAFQRKTLTSLRTRRFSLLGDDKPEAVPMGRPYLDKAAQQELLDHFDALSVNGFSSLEQLVGPLLSLGECRRAMRALDLDADAALDRFDFLRLFCPPDRRLPEDCAASPAPSDDDVGKNVETFLRYQCVKVGLLERTRPGSVLGPPSLACGLPPVPPETLEQWQRVFDELDAADDQKVPLLQLEEALAGACLGHSARQIVQHKGQWPWKEERVPRDHFLLAMAYSSGFDWQQQAERPA